MSNIVLTKPTTRSIATYCGHFLLRNEKTDVISWYLQCDITLRYLFITGQTLKYVCGMLSIQRHIVFIDHKKESHCIVLTRQACHHLNVFNLCCNNGQKIKSKVLCDQGNKFQKGLTLIDEMKKLLCVDGLTLCYIWCYIFVILISIWSGFVKMLN